MTLPMAAALVASRANTRITSALCPALLCSKWTAATQHWLLFCQHIDQIVADHAAVTAAGDGKTEIVFARGEVTREIRYQMKAHAIGLATLTISADCEGSSDSVRTELQVRSRCCHDAHAFERVLGPCTPPEAAPLKRIG